MTEDGARPGGPAGLSPRAAPTLLAVRPGSLPWRFCFPARL